MLDRKRLLDTDTRTRVRAASPARIQKHPPYRRRPGLELRIPVSPRLQRASPCQDSSYEIIQMCRCLKRRRQLNSEVLQGHGWKSKPLRLQVLQQRFPKCVDSSASLILYRDRDRERGRKTHTHIHTLALTGANISLRNIFETLRLKSVCVCA